MPEGTPAGNKSLIFFNNPPVILSGTADKRHVVNDTCTSRTVLLNLNLNVYTSLFVEVHFGSPQACIKVFSVNEHLAHLLGRSIF